MGQTDDAEISRRDARRSKRSRRGSADNSRRLAQFASRSQGTRADWGECAPERLQGVILAITRLGGAVTFGTSRDQGAFSCTLFLDGDRQQLWWNGDVDLDQELWQVEETLLAMA